MITSTSTGKHSGALAAGESFVKGAAASTLPLHTADLCRIAVCAGCHRRNGPYCSAPFLS